jgi:hypothetical protein
MRDEANFGVRVQRFVMMMVAIAVLAGGAVLTVSLASLSSDALALGSGVALGCVGALVPVMLILGSLRFVMRYLEEREARRTMRQQPMYGQQPMVIMMPQQYPQFQQPIFDPRFDPQLTGPRQFTTTVIGDEE